MKFKVLKEFDNVMLKRRQFDVLVEDIKLTPTRLEVAKQFAAKQGLDPKTLIIDTIFTEAGTEKVKVYAKAYRDVESLKKIEVKNNVENWNKIQEVLNPKKVAAPKEAKKEAPAKVEKKVEAPKEEKKEAPAKAEKKVEAKK